MLGKFPYVEIQASRITTDWQENPPDYAMFGVCFKQICHVQYHGLKTLKAST